jgi:hypothetical protein
MKKMIKAHEQKNIEVKVDEKKEGAVPAYLLDRENINRSKVNILYIRYLVILLNKKEKKKLENGLSLFRKSNS